MATAALDQVAQKEGRLIQEADQDGIVLQVFPDGVGRSAVFGAGRSAPRARLRLLCARDRGHENDIHHQTNQELHTATFPPYRLTQGPSDIT
jgi:hypothetical protein